MTQMATMRKRSKEDANEREARGNAGSRLQSNAVGGVVARRGGSEAQGSTQDTVFCLTSDRNEMVV